MAPKVIILLMFLAPVQLLAQQQQTPAIEEQSSQTTACLQPMKELLGEIGVHGGDITTNISEFIKVCTAEITNALNGKASRFTTPEALVSISALASSMIFKNPLLKLSAVGLGSYGVYESVVAPAMENIPEPSTQSTSTTSPPADDTTVPETPAQLVQETAKTYFNTIKKGKKQPIKMN